MHYGGNSASVSAHVDTLALYLASVGEVNVKEITELKTGSCYVQPISGVSRVRSNVHNIQVH